MLLSAEHIVKDYGGKPVLQDISLFVDDGAKIGLVGINGTGKSTLLKIMAGMETADAGVINQKPNLQISFLSQEPIMQDDHTIIEQVFDHFPASFRELNEYEAKDILTRLGIMDFDQKIGTLSGGQRKRVALAAAFIRPADVLILDEPTNHLDSDMVTWLEQRLMRYSGALVMVTHDRYFLERVANSIAELTHGALYLHHANYSRYLELKAERFEMETASERKRQALLRRETKWINQGAQGRGTKSTERIARYEALQDQDAPQTDDQVEIVTLSSRLGKKTIEIDGISKAFDGRTVIRDFSYTVLRDDRIGIVGKNGAGKSTLLNMMTGLLQPDCGHVDIGDTVKIGYFMQESTIMDPNERVSDYIKGIAPEIQTMKGTLSASQMMELFLFSSDLQYTTIGRLSGGERRRLYLLGILMTAPNILLLDEPTNDLDIDTLTILEDYLASFPCAVITVSHDRYFLDKVATTIFEVCMDGVVKQYAGNYADYLEKRTEEEAKTEKKEVRERQPLSPKQKKPKFSFNEEREFKTIDDDIAEMEEQVVNCSKEIDDNSSDYVMLEKLLAQKEELQAALDAKLERWVYLNDLAEQIEAYQAGE
ncbi:MAG: ABC-F family ATP-binding cassette domain-containing protein [Clostridiales bacterium]|nr:ABC-F family ATP-binding cassette domain-containing protein [Clostridiales bacterium]